MADTTADKAKQEDNNFLSTIWNKIWDNTGGKVEKAVNDFVSDSIAPLAIMLLEMVKSWLSGSDNSFFGNGGPVMKLIDNVENAFKPDASATDPKPTDPKAAVPAPAVQ